MNELETPAIVQAVTAIAVLVGVGLAVLDQTSSATRVDRLEGDQNHKSAAARSISSPSIGV